MTTKGGAIVGMLDSDPRPGVKILNERYTSKAFPRGNFEKDVLKSLESGAMTAIAPKFFLSGQFHFGRENIFQRPTSNGVVAKGSVLKVIILSLVIFKLL